MKNDDQSIRFDLSPLPSNDGEAVEWLMPLVRAADEKRLPETPSDVFKRGWYSIAFLYAGLHPDGALDHGAEVSDAVEDFPEITRLNRDFSARLMSRADGQSCSNR